MSSLADKLRKAGKLHAQGEFTLDVEQAGSKLSRFQFRSEHDFLFHMVAGLYRLGAARLDITREGSALVIKMNDLDIVDNLPKDLGLSLLEEFSPYRRLAAACQAVLAHEPLRFDWLGRGRDQVYDYLADNARNWHNVSLREIRLAGLADSLLNGALKELERAACYNRRGLTLHGKAVPGNSVKLGRIGEFAGWCFCDPSRSHPDLRLVVDEMLSEPKEVPTQIPWCGVVYWEPPQVRLDASLAAVVEDEAYHRLLEAIPQTYQTTVLALLPELPRNPRVRDFLLEQLRRPAPPWLDPIYDRLSQLALFDDQLGNSWSLHQLSQLEEVYYLNRLPAVAVEETVLVEKSSAALLCLKIHLGARLREATPVLLEQLCRQANFKKWQERPELGLKLPQQNWLLQDAQENWVVGLPDDWSSTGGSVTLLHGGRFLATRNLAHDELAFHLVYEVDVEDINAVWDDISKSAFQRLEPQWRYRVDELVKKLAHTDTELGPLRRYLISHLARHKRPDASYFSKTLLFEDWHGRRYSLHSLLEARSAGKTVGFVAPSREPEEVALPEAIYLRAGPDEIRCLSQVPGLKWLHFDLVFEDLDAARQPVRLPALPEWSVSCQETDFTGQLALLPDYGQARVHLRVRGFTLGWVSVTSALAYEAHLVSDTLRFNFRLDNERLGTARLTLLQNSDWKRCQAQLEEVAFQSMKLRLAQPLQGEWLDWARRGLLQGLGREFPALAEVECWPGEVSLKELLLRPLIPWSSQNLRSEQRSEFLAAHPEQSKLLAPLEPAVQQKLEKHYGGDWQCVDAWFAQKARLKEFLNKPPEELGHYRAVVSVPASSPFRGSISLLDMPEDRGQVRWLHRDRLVVTEEVHSHPCLWAQLESDQLTVNEDFDRVGPVVALTLARQQAAQQMTRVLADWLREPRPKHRNLLAHWRQWEVLGEAVAQGLKSQPWLHTNRGYQSWHDLMQVEKLYRLPQAPANLPTDITVLYQQGLVGDRLMAQHGNPVGVKQTEKYLEDRRRLQQQQAILRTQAARLKSHPYKAVLGEPHVGELALLARAQKDCWLVTDNRAVRIDNLPAGWAGYLQTDDCKLRHGAGEDVALLALPVRKHAFTAMIGPVTRRVQAGGLRRTERELVAEFVISALPMFYAGDPDEPWAGLADMRWLPCADAALVSLRQLRLEAQERGLVYWPKDYSFSSAGAVLTPILDSPLLLELVSRWCGQAPALREKPLIHRDLRELAAPRLSNWRQVLEGLGRWVVERRPRLSVPRLSMPQPIKDGLEKLQQRQMEKRQRESQHAAEKQRKVEEKRQQAEQQGAALLKAVRRQASLLLQGVARKEAMRYLEKARWSTDKSSLLWTFDGQQAVLYASHPQLAGWLGPDEPPAPVTLSLLLGLVSVINARSTPFTDEMERQFLERLLKDVVATYKEVM